MIYKTTCITILAIAACQSFATDRLDRTERLQYRLFSAQDLALQGNQKTMFRSLGFTYRKPRHGDGNTVSGSFTIGEVTGTGAGNWSATGIGGRIRPDSGDNLDLLAVNLDYQLNTDLSEWVYSLGLFAQDIEDVGQTISPSFSVTGAKIIPDLEMSFTLGYDLNDPEEGAGDDDWASSLNLTRRFTRGQAEAGYVHLVLEADYTFPSETSSYSSFVRATFVPSKGSPLRFRAALSNSNTMTLAATLRL